MADRHPALVTRPGSRQAGAQAGAHRRDSEDVWEDSKPEPPEWSYRLSISDHDNYSLYDRRGREIWGVVYL